jgi:hypothetical protein
MKDRIGNVLQKNDRVLVALPEAQIFGYVAEMQEGGLIAGVRSKDMKTMPGRVLVSCVIALPVDYEFGMVAQLVKVYDPDKPPEASASHDKPPN